MTFTVRESSLLGLVFILHCGVSFALVRGEALSQAPGEPVSPHRASEQTGLPASEADFQAQVQHVEQLARGLKAGQNGRRSRSGSIVSKRPWTVPVEWPHGRTFWLPIAGRISLGKSFRNSGSAGNRRRDKRRKHTNMPWLFALYST